MIEDKLMVGSLALKKVFYCAIGLLAAGSTNLFCPYLAGAADDVVLIKFASETDMLSADAFLQSQGLKKKKVYQNISSAQGRIYLSATPVRAEVSPDVHSKIGELVHDLSTASPEEADPEGALVRALVLELSDTSLIERADPNHRIQINGINTWGADQLQDSSPDDPRYSELWGMSNMGMEAAWELETGSEDVVVFVLDTGIDTDHEDLSDNLWVNPGEGPTPDGIDNDNNGYIDDIHGIDTVNNNSDLEDNDGHGTHVSGTIAAQGNNEIGVVGVNWDVKVGACKFIDVDEYGNVIGSVAGVVACFDYVIGLKNAGVNIVATNNSWDCDDGECVDGDILNDAIEASIGAGILPVLTSSNRSNCDIDGNMPVFPCKYTYPNVEGDSICVTAIDEANALPSGWGCYGATSVDMAAPGKDILSTFPDNLYENKSGTSMATPHVTGLLALASAYCPNDDIHTIRTAIVNGADPTAALEGKTATGGRANAPNTFALLCSSAAEARIVPILQLLLF